MYGTELSIGTTLVYLLLLLEDLLHRYTKEALLIKQWICHDAVLS